MACSVKQRVLPTVDGQEITRGDHTGHAGQASEVHQAPAPCCSRNGTGKPSSRVVGAKEQLGTATWIRSSHAALKIVTIPPPEIAHHENSSRIHLGKGRCPVRETLHVPDPFPRRRPTRDQAVHHVAAARAISVAPPEIGNAVHRDPADRRRDGDEPKLNGLNRHVAILGERFLAMRFVCVDTGRCVQATRIVPVGKEAKRKRSRALGPEKPEGNSHVRFRLRSLPFCRVNVPRSFAASSSTLGR